LNAVIRAVVKAAARREVAVVGYLDGFEGVIEGRKTLLTPETTKGIVQRAGTILGCGSRLNPYDDHGVNRVDDVRRELAGLDALILIGGNGSMGIATDLTRDGLPVIGVPKTIDNDIVGTDETFGFDTAVAVATEAIDRLHATAEAHHRVFVVELMGRDVGWITLYAGVSGGADVVLLPERPFNIEAVVAAIAERDARGRRFTIVAVAEGACPAGGEALYDLHDGRRHYGGIATWLAEQLAARTGHDARPVILGYLQRGGEPTARDRRLATMFGAKALDLAASGTTGAMVAMRNGALTTAPLRAGQTRCVPADDPVLAAARAIGISDGTLS
jgi:6-phosphofructokinase 1